MEENIEKLYEDAVQVVRAEGKAGCSLLQRRLRIGYALSARLIDMMEERGVVGPPNGSAPRTVLHSTPTPPTEDRDWRAELDGYDTTEEDGYKLFHIPERDLMTIIDAAEARGRESRQSEVDFLVQEAYGDNPPT